MARGTARIQAMLSEELRRKLESLPTQPGCYIMKDRAGAVVYVGKAVNLRARVAQYFQERTGDSRIFIPFLTDLLGDIEVMITPSEKDALLLENELIKKHRPRFNIRLRDDKNFISLRLSRTHPYPRLEVVRRVRKDGARYFGPYSSASSIRETLGIVNRHFQLRTCTDQVMANRRRPCLQYQIKRCPAPCVYSVPQDEYQRSVEEVALFLEGKADQLTAQLSSRMKDAAGKLQYERAAQLRDQLQAIERSLEKQRTVVGESIEQDVLGFHREGGLLEIQLLFFRGGRLSGGRSFNFSRQEFPTEELLSSFLDQYYESGAFIPKELLLPMELPEPESREAWLSERKGERVRVHVPERGEKARLLEMASENARHNFDERQRTEKNAVETLQRLQTRLRLPRLPRRIECFDISTFQGQLTVGSQVVFTDGEPDKSGYRLFKVRGEAAGDDFASMFQVLTRRLKRALETPHDQNLPDLLVVDGGKGQLNVARAALRELGLSVSEVPLAGLAKSRVLEDEQRFAARQGYRTADAWEQRAGPDAEAPQQIEPAPSPKKLRRWKDSTCSWPSACSASSPRRASRQPNRKRRKQRRRQRPTTAPRCSMIATTSLSTQRRRNWTRSKQTTSPRRSSQRLVSRGALRGAAPPAQAEARSAGAPQKKENPQNGTACAYKIARLRVQDRAVFPCPLLSCCPTRSALAREDPSMKLYPKIIPAIARDVIATLMADGDVEVETMRVADAEMDMAAILKEYLASEERVNQATREALERRGYDHSRFNQVKREMADVRGFKMGDEGIDYIINQMIEFLLISRNIEEVFAEDHSIRRKIYQVFKKHLDVDEDIDREARSRLKHLSEGTQAWEVEYQKTVEQIRRNKGLL